METQIIFTVQSEDEWWAATCATFSSFEKALEYAHQLDGQVYVIRRCHLDEATGGAIVRVGGNAASDCNWTSFLAAARDGRVRLLSLARNWGIGSSTGNP